MSLSIVLQIIILLIVSLALLLLVFNLYKPNFTSRLSQKGINSVDDKSHLNILVFSGGTGFREININLAKLTNNITRVLPIWDNGGSSKILRDNFQMLPVGDLRHALMTMAHGEGRVSTIVKLFNWRLSSSDDKSILRRELNSFVNYEHPLIKSIEQRLSHVVLGYLKKFAYSIDENFDLRNGSIGNFVLVGAYLAHNKDINSAIYVFRKLCHIQGHVWPVSLHDHLHINAQLSDGGCIYGQADTTQLESKNPNNRIEKIIFSENQTQNSMEHEPANINPMVDDAIDNTSLIVYGPGSFFTSILPHMMVESVAEKIAVKNIPKVFIANLLEDGECNGYTASELIKHFIDTAIKHSNHKFQANQFITHILINKSHSTAYHLLNNHHYLQVGDDIEKFREMGIELIIDDIESPWKRGSHDARWISEYLYSIL
ncbi:MAG: YvcK family protein [Gammaproteobacteria bacterium]|nr:YvcK family protein [Gammaproteobacteria bacterium]